MATDAPVRVLYIVGAGRSGSTVLDIVLGNHPEIQSVGELRNLPYSGWAGGRATRSPYCSCGRTVAECPFWSAVRREWVARVGEEDARAYPALQSSFERYRSLPRLVLELLRGPSPEFRAYARLTGALFEAIRTASGKAVVVDSSKNPLRALTLSMAPGVDLHLVHLVRDARGVVSSRKKAFKKDHEAGLARDIEPQPAWNSAVFWLLINLLSGWVRRRLGAGRSARVRYEDFVAHPRRALVEIGPVAGLDLAGLAGEVSGGEALEVGHNVGGNRLRMTKGGVRLRPEAGGWKSTLSAREERTTWAVSGWLMRRYGYAR